MSNEITLRIVRDADLGVFFAQQSDPAAYRMVAFAQRDPADRNAFAEHWGKIQSDETVIIKTIVVNGLVAGYVGSFEHEGKREVCYHLGREYWGLGIGTAALSRFLGDFPSRPLFAGVAEDNVGSIRVLEKCGFQAAERRRAFTKARGCEINEVIMRLD